VADVATVPPIEIPVRLVFGVPEVAEVRRLVVRPGDKLVMHLDHCPNDAEAADLIDRLHRALGDDVTVLILEPGEDLDVLSLDRSGT
jgi:hypothetical protein